MPGTRCLRRAHLIGPVMGRYRDQPPLLRRGLEETLLFRAARRSSPADCLSGRYPDARRQATTRSCKTASLPPGRAGAPDGHGGHAGAPDGHGGHARSRPSRQTSARPAGNGGASSAAGHSSDTCRRPAQSAPGRSARASAGLERAQFPANRHGSIARSATRDAGPRLP